MRHNLLERIKYFSNLIPGNCVEGEELAAPLLTYDYLLLIPIHMYLTTPYDSSMGQMFWEYFTRRKQSDLNKNLTREIVPAQFDFGTEAVAFLHSVFTYVTDHTLLESRAKSLAEELISADHLWSPRKYVIVCYTYKVNWLCDIEANPYIPLEPSLWPCCEIVEWQVNCRCLFCTFTTLF